MMRAVKAAFLAAIFAGLSACATGPQIAPAGVYQAGDMRVTLQSDWNAIAVKTHKNAPGHILTKDGPDLNAVYLFSNLKPGDGLMKDPGEDNPVPKFAADMTDLEMTDMLVDTLLKSEGFARMQTSDIRPGRLGGAPAVRFDLSGSTAAGLTIEGRALMRNTGGTLSAILFLAPSEYYAGKYAGEVDAIFESVSQ